jgi:hypothetical protein
VGVDAVDRGAAACAVRRERLAQLAHQGAHRLAHAGVDTPVRRVLGRRLGGEQVGLLVLGALGGRRV